ncbi:MAG TPA: YjbH domain-containing protein [Rhizomicrobium sp.]
MTRPPGMRAPEIKLGAMVVSEIGESPQGSRARAKRAAQLGCAAIAIALALAPAARAQDVLNNINDEPFEQNRTTYGDVGLIEVPSARMAPDGEMSLTGGALDSGQWRIGLGFQALPWLETSFRYSHIPNFFKNGTTILPLYDRSFGMKVRLFQETAWSPALAVGARDLVGTGIYGAEYVVLSKRFWTVDFTAGLGWGRLASTGMFNNPLGQVFQSFNVRSVNTGVGGTVAFGQLFHGPDTSVFGGFNWQTPIEKLNLMVEYSPDRYLRERQNTHFFTRMPVNVAATYRIFDHVNLMAGWLYGTTWGAAVTVHFDPLQPLFKQRLGTPPMPAALRDPQQRSSALNELNQHNPIMSVNGGGVSLTMSSDPTELKRVLEAAPSSAARDFEVDGRTLAINVEGANDLEAQCRIYSQVVGAAVSGIDAVAITDLSDHDGHDGKVVLCAVPHHNQTAALSVSSLGNDAPGSGGTGDATEGAPVLDEQTLQFRPTITDPRLAERKIREDADDQNLEVDAVSVGPTTALVYVSNTKYYFESEGIGRLTRILLSDTPASVEIFRIVSIYHGVPVREVKLLRSDIERVINLYGSAAEIRDSLSILDAPMDNPVLDAQANDYPRFGWSLYPRLERSFFDPKSPARFGLFADASGYAELLPGLTLETVLEAAILNDLGTGHPSDSVLPHVRSDFGLYYDKGANGVSLLDATYRTRLASDVYAEFKAGYLEDMFMGAGGQVLWRPNGQRWALGVDAYQVWQRSFDRLFGIQHYNIVTGHVNIYYESPWYGFNFQLHGGRYLAGDWGATFQISREFETGVEIGAFATFTNVPFNKFGEGSFDKGVIVRIPLEWFVPIHTQSAANLDFRPLTRDGGQRLDNDDSLYDETRRTSYGEIDRHINDIVSP